MQYQQVTRRSTHTMSVARVACPLSILNRPACRQNAPLRVKSPSRSRTGSVLPVLAFSLLLIFAFLAFTVDVMREFLEAGQLHFAARSAALDMLPFACLDANGQIQNDPVCSGSGAFTGNAMSNLTQALNAPNGASAGEAWNSASSNSGSGDQNWMQAVNFSAEDIRSGSASGTVQDKQDPLLQLQVDRTGENGLQLFFMPLVFAFNTAMGAPVPQSAETADQSHIVEVASQPATRIGAAAPLDASSPKAQAMAKARCAGFPLAINYDDFKRASTAAGAGSFSCTAHLSAAQSSQMSSATDMRGYFVNLSSGTQVSSFYNEAQNPARISDLIGTLMYFDSSPSQPVSATLTLPAAIERGVQVDRYAPAAVKSSSDAALVISQLSLNKCYIVPVVREGVSPSTQCQVLGFALLRLTRVAPSSSGWDFSFTLGESLPILNASCSGQKTIPNFDGTALPSTYDAQNSPFKLRSFDVTNNVLAARAKGVVMAAVVSPRRISDDAS